MYYIVRLIQYHRRTIGALMFGLAFSLTIAYATPPVSPYIGGETLDPSCAPGDANCTVSIFPDQTGNAGKYLTTDGATLSWATVAGGSLIGSTSTLGTETWLGTSAADMGTASTSGTVFIGIDAGKNATGSSQSNFIGRLAGSGASGADYSNFIGDSAGISATNANYSNFFGAEAGAGVTNGALSNFFGYQSGNSATNASESNFFGAGSGTLATNAVESNFFGSSAGLSATNAGESNFFGYRAGMEATDAAYSNFFGSEAGMDATNASGSNFIGDGSGNAATNASGSNFFGKDAGLFSTNASNSIFIGTEAGTNDLVDNTGDADNFSILIGPNTSTNGNSNSIAIGGYATNTAPNQLMIGSTTRAINQMVINGVNPYINFGTTGGTSGYGFRDNAGTVEYKNFGGAWAAIGGGSGVTSVSGTTDRITSTGGATPVIDISASYVGQTSLTTLGTITTGTWQGTAIGDTYISSAATWNAKEDALTFSTGLTRTTNTVTNNLSTGLAGGQSVVGGTASGQSLTLSSTTNGTKGSILFGSSSYSEANNTLGIGTTASTTNKITFADIVLAGSGSLAGSVLSATQTWNTTGAPTALKLNVTNTASGAAALLMDLQVGGVSQFKVSKAGNATQMMSQFGTSASGAKIFSMTTTPSVLNTAGTNLAFYNATINAAATGGAFAFTGEPMVQTSGSVYTVTIPQYFTPSSGTATYAALGITGNITQTGGANGITRGIFINPNLSTVVDYRAVDLANNSGYGIYQSGASALNYFAGKTGIGMTGASVALDVTGDIEYTGTITDVSDARLKDNITDFESGLAIVNAIGVKNYNMIASPEKVETGFIAQNVNEFFPQAVSIVDPVHGYMGVSYVSFIPVLTKAVQELDIKVLDIATLQAEQANAFGSFANSFFSEVLASVEGGIAYMRNIVVETIKIGSPDKRTGITMYDEVTGEPFCLSIANGTTKTVAGECGIIEHIEESPEEDVPIDTTEETPIDDGSEDPIDTEGGDEQPPADEAEDTPPQDLPVDEVSTDENPPVEIPPAQESTPESTPPADTPVTP
ncbi:MAG: tail fiber domain-containing protein [Candidatus Pacebacteria bacterium]|nr:tail fiber domain-containing protein [Candidatus Paceibacterota bacterium]MBP9701059.1 tail fiber domain-containing protein [Candidatus Paceibacterota bacterium]